MQLNTTRLKTIAVPFEVGEITVDIECSTQTEGIAILDVVGGVYSEMDKLYITVAITDRNISFLNSPPKRTLRTEHLYVAPKSDNEDLTFDHNCQAEFVCKLQGSNFVDFYIFRMKCQ